MDFQGIPTRYHKKKLEHKLKTDRKVQKLTKRSKILQPVSAGFLEKEENELITQQDILASVDIGVANKIFELKLGVGPYSSLDYSSNGRYLSICSLAGHLGMFDWMTKKLLFETNVQNDRCHSVKFLHQETMIAVAQEKHMFMYDNAGVELHCIKQLNCIRTMEFLPYHFLLATGSSKGYVSYLDVTMGEIVLDIPTYTGPIHKSCLNPVSAVYCTGHKSGTVAMWTPSEKKYVAKLLCHPGPVEALAVDPTGSYLCTASLDKRLKVWDLRNHFEPLAEITLPLACDSMCYSQSGLLALSSGFITHIFKDAHNGAVSGQSKLKQDGMNVLAQAYLTHHSASPVMSMQFCPFEDILGMANKSGFSSIIVPGAGEANFDAMEENPFASKTYRQEREVRRLLNRIPYDLISLDSRITQVRQEDILDEWERKRSVIMGEVAKIEPVKVKRNKKKGRSKATRIEIRKQAMKMERSKLEQDKMMCLRKDEGIQQLLRGETAHQRQQKDKETAADEAIFKRPTDILIKPGRRNIHFQKPRIKNSLDILIPTKSTK